MVSVVKLLDSNFCGKSMETLRKKCGNINEGILWRTCIGLLAKAGACCKAGACRKAGACCKIGACCSRGI